MSAATVRAALAAFFQSPPIPGMGVVYEAEPFFSPGQDREPISGGTSGAGAVGFVWLHEAEETRLTLPAVTGSKRVHYLASLVLRYNYLRQTNDGTVSAPDAWIGPLDDLLDQIRTRIHSDPTFGNPAVIFEAGQDENGVSIRWDAPKQNGMKVECWLAVDFHVTEIVTA